MKVKLIEKGEIAEVSDLYGERLIEQGKAVPALTIPEPKAEVTVTDHVPHQDAEETAENGASAEEGAKTAATKKAGKKR